MNFPQLEPFTLEEADKNRRSAIIDKVIEKAKMDFIQPNDAKKFRCKRCGAEVKVVYGQLCFVCAKSQSKKGLGDI